MSDIARHISTQFNASLNEVRTKVLEMGGLVEKQVGEAVRALLAGDSQLAEEVASADYKVNSLEVTIDEECSKILALRHPVAGDLRLVVMMIKTITDLERIGDEAERIAKLATRLAESDMPKSQLRIISHLGEHVKRMLHDALDAHARLDTDAAFRVVREDLIVDDEYEAAMRQLMTFMMEDARQIKHVLDVVWCARSLERIGDHSKNICEYVIYMVEGKDVRHVAIDQMERQLNPSG